MSSYNHGIFLLCCVHVAFCLDFCDKSAWSQWKYPEDILSPWNDSTVNAFILSEPNSNCTLTTNLSSEVTALISNDIYTNLTIAFTLNQISGHNSGILVRSNGPQSGYMFSIDATNKWFYMGNGCSQDMNLTSIEDICTAKIGATSNRVQSAITGSSVTTGVDINVKIVVSGDSISAYINGVLQRTADDVNDVWSHGGVQLRAFQEINSIYSNFVFTVPAPSISDAPSLPSLPPSLTPTSPSSTPTAPTSVPSLAPTTYIHGNATTIYADGTGDVDQDSFTKSAWFWVVVVVVCIGLCLFVICFCIAVM